MDALDQALIQAGQHIIPMLQANPAERLVRLARRRLAAINRPPRAWCLAIRASDTRLHPHWAYVQPSTHGSAVPRSTRQAHADHQPHTIDLSASLIRQLTAPVRIPPPGEDWQVVANMLGVHEETLRRSIKLGVLRAHHIPRLGGKRGKPVPVLYSPDLLDPSNANSRTPSNPLWGSLWQTLAQQLPDDFCQTLTRSANSRQDPRDAPGAKPRFRGWHWHCPACDRRVRTVFLPMPPYTLQSLLGYDLQEDGSLIPIEHADLAPHHYPTTFACHHCHRIRYFDSQSREGWNHLITHLSGGLLYGSEVQCL